MATLMETRYVAFTMLWYADDPVLTGARVWLATGYTDIGRRFPSLTPQVQEVLRKDLLSGICSSSAVVDTIL